MGIGRACGVQRTLSYCVYPLCPPSERLRSPQKAATTVPIVAGLGDLISLSVIGGNSRTRPDNSEKASCHLIRRRRQYMFTLAPFLNRLLWIIWPNHRRIQMKASHEILKSRVFRNGLAISLLASAVCLSNLPVAAQDQRNQSTATVQQSNGQPALDATPQNGAPSSPVAPATISLPAGTMIPVRISEWLSSDKNQPGDRFSASLEQPLVANGWVVAARGQIVTGRVALAKKAGRVSGVSQLEVELSELTLVDGQVLPAQTQLLQTSPGTSNGRHAAGVATTTGVGAAIGAA